MSDQTPAVGDIVRYTLTEGDVDSINRRRDAGEGHGNRVRPGQTFPAAVVRSFDATTAVNLQVLLDGIDTYWATSRPRGEGPGQWMPTGAARVDDRKPQRGTFVDYQSYGTPGGEYAPEPLTALITKVWNGDTVNLLVFYPEGGTSPKASVVQADEPTPGYWSWPSEG